MKALYTIQICSLVIIAMFIYFADQRSDFRTKITYCTINSITAASIEDIKHSIKVCNYDYDCYDNYLDGLSYKKLDKCLDKVLYPK